MKTTSKTIINNMRTVRNRKILIHTPRELLSKQSAPSRSTLQLRRPSTGNSRLLTKILRSNRFQPTSSKPPRNRLGLTHMAQSLWRASTLRSSTTQRAQQMVPTRNLSSRSMNSSSSLLKRKPVNTTKFNPPRKMT